MTGRGSLVDQPKPYRPTRKVAAGAGAGGAAATIVWIGQLVGVEIPAPVAAYLAVLAAGVVSFLVRDRQA